MHKKSLKFNYLPLLDTAEGGVGPEPVVEEKEQIEFV